ncbi:MAG: hypothetical protein JWM51_1581, partial [Microbacteriaceae bacterium]|nr:hypothetical protein [Microbacteriaceae bacterium]
PITITSRTPAAGATGVARASAVAVTLSSAVKPGYSLTASSGGTAIAGTTTQSTDATTITFTPSAAMPAGATVQVTLSGVVSTQDATLATQTWSFTTVTAAPAPITITARTPASGATNVTRESRITVTLSGPIKPGYSLTASSGGAPIAGTSTLSTDAMTITFAPTSLLPNAAQVQVTLSGVVSTQDATLATQTWSFTTLNSDTLTVTNHSLFGSETPAVALESDTDAVEVGVSFTPSAAGSVTAIRFYKGGASNGGTHLGRLWSSSGTKLAEVTFSAETASGWQVAQLSTPVALQAGQLYVVSYYAPQGSYSYTSSYFSSPKISGVLTAGTANNGRYRYATGGGFPTLSWGASNYFVDVVYSVPNSGGGTPPPVTPPTPPPTPPSNEVGLFGSETPAVASTADTDPVEVGVAFSSTVAGKATSVRFYKGTGNAGTHVGHLWSSTGQLLGTANFTGETASGWQTAQFATPVTLAAGTTYVVSYFAPQGRYSSSDGYFSTAKTNGSLTAPASGNGKFVYSSTGGFPTREYSRTNYFVDVGFTPAP